MISAIHSFYLWCFISVALQGKLGKIYLLSSKATLLNIKYAAYLLLKTAFATFTECTDYAMLIIFYFLLYFMHLNLSIFFWFLSLLCILNFFLFGFFSHPPHLFHSSFSLCFLNSELDSSLIIYAVWSCEWIWSSALSILGKKQNP